MVNFQKVNLPKSEPKHKMTKRHQLTFSKLTNYPSIVFTTGHTK
jgi:hypothetical protein